MFTAYHAKYYAHALTLRHGSEGVDRLSQSLFDAGVDLNPHQIDAALFALKNPLSKGVILADEVGLGKTIEAALVLGQYWAERKRRLLIICPASLRKQWAQELLEKFNLPSVILDAASLRKLRHGQAFDALTGKHVIIISYQFATKLELDLLNVAWNLVVIDEAHKLRNAHKTTNRIGQSLRRALAGRQKLLLTATPLQNSLLELYGLSTLIDEHQFGDETAFRRQYMQSGADLPALRQRLEGFVQRSLRRDVLEYVNYTERKPLTQKFRPTDDEQQLYEDISDFLQDEESYALPKRQRHLTALILRKLLASSAPAIVATLQTICKRLETLLATGQNGGTSMLNDGQFIQQLVEEEELEDDYLEEIEEDVVTTKDEPNIVNLNKVRAELAQIQSFINAATSLRTDTKAQSLLQALDAGFGKMAELNGPKKAIIFTESRRTQDYLVAFLNERGYTGKIVTFSGTNNSDHATRIYRDWLARHKDTERVTGSPQVDKRTALIDHFRGEGVGDNPNGAEIMIATEAAAEGVNLQFCALIINYDLPWNPQRIEQRIGRCHRYGQRFDVVVINFLNLRNHADQRVLELLTEKFNLFSGVFGASDEVLGRIESGIDFEKRILQIVESCRQPAQIEAAFTALQTELEQDINTRIRETQSQLLEHFDEDVHERLKLRLNEAEARLDKLGKWFWGATRHVLDKCAKFDEAHYAFSLNQPPSPGIAAGRYQLIRGAVQPDMLAHPYRLTHTLGEWTLAQATNVDTPTKHITFDHSHHPTRISALDAYRNQNGWLRLVRLQVQAFDTTERLLFIAQLDDGTSLDQELCEKLMLIESPQQSNTSHAITDTPPTALDANTQRRIEAEVASILDSNQKLFMDERDKLEKWADDKLLTAETDLSDTKARIAQKKRDARKAASLEEQNNIQNELRELEQKQRKQRQDIFIVEDQIAEQRDGLINALQLRLAQNIETDVLYTIRWSLR